MAWRRAERERERQRERERERERPGLDYLSSSRTPTRAPEASKELDYLSSSRTPTRAFKKNILYYSSTYCRVLFEDQPTILLFVRHSTTASITHDGHTVRVSFTTLGS